MFNGKNRIAHLMPDLSASASASVASGGNANGKDVASICAAARDPNDLLARLIAPRTDGRRQDVLHRDIRRRLMDEFSPSTHTEQWTIDLIASDMVHLVRVRQAIELLMAVQLPEKVHSDARRAAEVNRRATLLERQIRLAGEDKRFDLTEIDADCLASVLKAQFQGLRDSIADIQAEADDPDAKEMGSSEDYRHDPEDRRYLHLHEIVKPIEVQLLDTGKIKQVLMGQQILLRDELLRWIAILRLTKETVTGQAYAVNKAAAEVSAAERALLVELARNPVQVALLHRCAAQIEEAIDKRLRWLEAVQRES